MGAEDFTAARGNDALAGHAAVTIVAVMTPSFVITRANAGLERSNPHAQVLGRSRSDDGKRCHCRQSKHECSHDILLFFHVVWEQRSTRRHRHCSRVPTGAGVEYYLFGLSDAAAIFSSKLHQAGSRNEAANLGG